MQALAKSPNCTKPEKCSYWTMDLQGSLLLQGSLNNPFLIGMLQDENIVNG